MIAARPPDPASRRAIRCHLADGVGIALADLAPGEVVCRYGEAIGRATAGIAPGDHVHTHNLATALTGERRYAASGARAAGPAAASLGTWHGYPCADGRFATRNEIWLLPTVGCVAPLAEMAAREASLRHAGRIDAIAGFGHPHGCSRPASAGRHPKRR